MNTNINVSPSGGVLTIAGDTTAAAGVGITKTGQGVLEMKAIRAQRLTINAGAVKVLPSGTVAGTSNVEGLVIVGSTDAWSGSLDLTDNALVIDYTGTSPLATVQNQLKNGFNGGAWTGNGITSSAAAASAAAAHRTALGIAEAADFNGTFPATFRGQTIDSTSVLVRYTASGDANLDGTVDLTDFTVLAANFNGTAKRWARGDFDYSGNVDLTDFTFVASNFNYTIPAAAAAVAPAAIATAVPEPAVLGLFAAAAASLAGRTRRGHGGSNTGRSVIGGLEARGLAASPPISV